MKKFLTYIAVCMIALVFAGCGKAAKNDGISVVTTIFPEYDWVNNILGDNPAGVEVTMLLDKGVDLHSFQPSAEDIMKVSTCDLFIYVGGESDEWVGDALKESVNKDMKVINLLEVLGDSVKEEEVKEGMEADHDHDHEHEEGEDHDHEHEEDHDHEHEEGEEHDHDHDEEEGPEYDEHVWLSLKSSAVICKAIEEALAGVDSANAGVYEKNLAAYLDKLSVLDSRYEQAVAAASVKTLVFADRFPFRYMVDDYGLDYYAAFVGCSAETEASFETVMFLAGKVDELGLKHVMVIEGNDHRIADTVISSATSGEKDVLVLDSLQSVTGADVQKGVTYLSVMESNLEVLKQALN